MKTDQATRDTKTILVEVVVCITSILTREMVCLEVTKVTRVLVIGRGHQLIKINMLKYSNKIHQEEKKDKILTLCSLRELKIS